MRSILPFAPRVLAPRVLAARVLAPRVLAARILAARMLAALVLSTLVLAGCQPARTPPAAPVRSAARPAAGDGPCPIALNDHARASCHHPPPPPDHSPFCTRSLGTVDCWTNPEVLNGPLHEVADGQTALTPEQARDQARKDRGLWPF